jgi:hypothetical protein
LSAWYKELRFLLAWADESFADKEGYWDGGHILRRGDGAFYRGIIQSDWTTWSQTDRVEVRFQSSKGDELRDGTVMMRGCKDSPFPLQYGGEAVELVIELLSSCMFLPSHAPLAAFDTARGN